MSTPTPDHNAGMLMRLRELLDIKDARLQALEMELSDLRRQIDFGVDWMAHTRADKSDGLPCPRIQMRITDNSEYRCETVVEMVLTGTCGRLTRIPLEYSKRSGGGVDPRPWPEAGDVPEGLLRGGVLPSTMHDARFYGEQTGLPVFFVLDEDRSYRVTSQRPLQMSTVSRSALAQAGCAERGTQHDDQHDES